ncbi:MAG: proline dehydrogenase family protein [Clostridia bacterium]|nr:proline dehydrogenase family protein [Clostridia bacterium]
MSGARGGRDGRGWWPRAAVLAVAGHPAVERLARRYGLRLGASRFVAGETLEDALRVVRELRGVGLEVTLDHLGEGVASPDAARAARDAYLGALDGLAAASLFSHVSVKPTQMGLALDPSLALDLVAAIAARARELGTFVRLDMENSTWVDATLGLYEALRDRGFDNVGVVIQAYLYRSEADLQRLQARRANVRIVKGAYLEPPAVAMPRKADVDANFLRLVRSHLQSGCYTAVATHDERMIQGTLAAARELGVGEEGFEFQMLYGVRPDLQRRLRDEGHRVRIYVPYGTEWYPYFTRRLAERPANLWFVLQNLLRT